MIRIIGDKLRQYDLNRLVELAPKSGLTLESVSFQKNGPEPLVTAHREEDGMIVADIPNILLKAYGTLTVECHLVDADGYHISEKASFTVCKRDMPADYEYVATPVLKLGAGGASSWTDMPDKPFYEETATVLEPLNITWDGNTEGLTFVPMGASTAYRMSDAMPTLAQLQTGTVDMGFPDTDDKETDIPISDFVVMLNDSTALILSGERIQIIVLYDGTTLNAPNGLYFSKEDVGGIYVASLTTTEPVEQTKTVVKPIDTKFLPEPLQFGGEIEVPGDTLTWDGNTDGRYIVGNAFVKISDATPTMEDFANGCIRETSVSGKMDIPPDSIYASEGTLQVAGEAVMIVPEANTSWLNLLFEEAGIYTIFAHPDRFVSLTIPGYTGFPTKAIKPIDKKYLPADIGGSTRFRVATNSHKIYVADGSEVEATSADVDAALNKGPVYFEDIYYNRMTSMFQIEFGNTAGYYIRLFYSSGSYPSETYVKTSDFEAGAE